MSQQDWYDQEQTRRWAEGQARAKAAAVVRGGPTPEGVLRAARKRWHAAGDGRVNLEWPLYETMFSEAEQRILRESCHWPLTPTDVLYLRRPPTPNDVIRERRRKNLLKDLRYLAEEEPAQLRKILMAVFVVAEPDGNPAPDPSAPLAAPAAGNGVRLAA